MTDISQLWQAQITRLTVNLIYLQGMFVNGILKLSKSLLCQAFRIIRYIVNLISLQGMLVNGIQRLSKILINQSRKKAVFKKIRKLMTLKLKYPTNLCSNKPPNKIL